MQKSTPAFVAFITLFFLLVGGAIVVGITEAYDNYKFNHLSSAEHLRLAQEICHSKQFGAICYSADPTQASRHLEKIPSTAPEYGEAASLLTIIRQQEQSTTEHQQQALAKAKAEAAQGKASTTNNYLTCSRGYPKWCSKEDDGPCALKPIMSFDNGTSWLQDDGRCAAKEQKQRDEDARPSSYWSTTIRVDTDMDSFWLPDEERTCQTYPNDKGRVAVVACNASGSHRGHNIPVKFWGGLDRNTVSDWKCRREKSIVSDEFVCRAID